MGGSEMSAAELQEGINELLGFQKISANTHAQEALARIIQDLTRRLEALADEQGKAEVDVIDPPVVLDDAEKELEQLIAAAKRPRVVAFLKRSLDEIRVGTSQKDSIPDMHAPVARSSITTTAHYLPIDAFSFDGGGAGDRVEVYISQE